jgi:hypothetical protein
MKLYEDLRLKVERNQKRQEYRRMLDEQIRFKKEGLEKKREDGRREYNQSRQQSYSVGLPVEPQRISYQHLYESQGRYKTE